MWFHLLDQNTNIGPKGLRFRVMVFTTKPFWISFRAIFTFLTNTPITDPQFIAFLLKFQVSYKNNYTNTLHWTYLKIFEYICNKLHIGTIVTFKVVFFPDLNNMRRAHRVTRKILFSLSIFKTSFTKSFVLFKYFINIRLPIYYNCMHEDLYIF